MAIRDSSEKLELDHIDPSTRVSHAVWSWAKNRREEELAKCQVLCHDCHVKKTNKETYKPRKHGTVTKYHKDKCRCDLCKAAATKAKRDYRLRKKTGVPLKKGGHGKVERLEVL